MPQQRHHSDEAIVDAAIDLVRKQDIDALSARTLAAQLGCSVKPIFDAYGSMDNVRQAVWNRAQALYESRVRQAMASDEKTPYKASGMAYLDFARDEPQLFRMLFMSPTDAQHHQHQEHSADTVISTLAATLHISEADAARLHGEIWIATHGLATMIATGYLNPDREYIEQYLNDIFLGLTATLHSKERARA